MKRTHGHTIGYRITPEYRCYTSMLTRCRNPASTYFSDYGGRGISVCGRWLASFAHFIADMGLRPQGRSLDRIDVNGHYEPTNCRWATWKEQQRNRRDNRVLEHAGERMCIAAWAERIGMDQATLRRRLINGWSVERALCTPVRPCAKRRVSS